MHRKPFQMVIVDGSDLVWYVRYMTHIIKLEVSRRDIPRTTLIVLQMVQLDPGLG